MPSSFLRIAQATAFTLATLGGTGLFAQDISSTAAQDQLVFDFGAAHNFAGLGTELWTHPPHQAEQDAALKDLHVRYVRVAINWSIPTADLTAQSQLSVDDLTALIKKNDIPRFDASVATFATEIKTLGIEMHFIFFMMPKCWLVQTGTKSWHANPAQFENGANWITAQLIRAKAAGLVPSHIEISNEPEGDWNTQFTPEQYDAYLVAVRKALDANGLQDIKIAGPGCGTGVAPTVPILTAVEDNDDGKLLDILSVHLYDRGIDAKGFPQLDLLKPLMDKLAPGTQLFITEYNSKAHYWGDPPYETRANQRGPKNGGDTADFGISSIGDGLKAIAEGANSIFFWEASDQPWGHADYGWIDLNGQGKPVLTATKIGLKSLPWDVPAVGATGGSESLVAVAFKTPDGVRVSMVNLTPDPHAITATFKGLDLPPGTVSDVSTFDAKAGEKAVANQPVVTDGTLTDTLPPRTLVSFLLK